jgi:drug/metabolite transporter (DMT)-like permease
MGKVLLQELQPLQVSWLRYASAFAALLVLWPLLSRRPLRLPGRFLPWVLVMGLTTFFASPLLQYSGLARSTASANAVIVALEPLCAVLLAWLVLREQLGWRQVTAILCALCGFLLLSNLNPLQPRSSLSLFSVGNLLILGAMPMEAAYTIVSRRLAGKVDPVILFAYGLTAGFLLLSVYLWASGIPFALPSLTYRNLLAVCWLGPLGTALTYIFWTVALERATVAAVSLTLFAQPILGAAFGAFFLGERFSTWQAAGGVLILSALLLQVVQPEKKGKSP